MLWHTPEGVIYVLQEMGEPAGAVKFSSAPSERLIIRRLRALQSGNPRRLMIVAQAPSSERVDFHGQRIGSSRWYSFEGSVVDFVKLYRVQSYPVAPNATSGDVRKKGGNRSTPWRQLVRHKPLEAKRRILRAYLAVDGVTARACSLLDISRRTLYRYIHKLNLAAEIARIRRSAS